MLVVKLDIMLLRIIICISIESTNITLVSPAPAKETELGKLNTPYCQINLHLAAPEDHFSLMKITRLSKSDD